MKPRLLMSRPNHFGVNYVINPWMRGNVGRVDHALAVEQWKRLHELLRKHATIEYVEPEPDLPDMVFTANFGLACDELFIPSRFRFAQRAGEVPPATQWFETNGFRVHELHGSASFEGEGDGLFQPGESLLWAGYGVRTGLQVYREIASRFRLAIRPLRLVDERFYHLDTCFAPIPGGRAVYYPNAFDHDSVAVLRNHFPPDRRIEVSAEDALAFACNAVVFDDLFVCNHASESLRQGLSEWNYRVQTIPLNQFMLAGGAAKCLVLRLDNTVPEPVSVEAPPEIAERSVVLQGQLLDTGMLNTALDAITDLGGTFDFEEFRPGLRHDEPSTAQLRVAAPSEDSMEEILAALLQFGARLEEEALREANLVPAEADGVAPRNFYSTTIYPTDVYVRGQWVRVANQRMDAVLQVELDGDNPRVSCRLIRDLKRGDLVVCGAEGVVVEAPKEEAEEESFSFMGEAVSSERRVEAVIDQIAWEMDRIRSQNGKIVVVAGPVVVHTGGATYLAQLIERGFVQVLLGGNAIAVHDVEHNLLGTSLGVDLAKGRPMPGGHRHHLYAINEVRRAGSIRAAVEQGVITGGIMHACVRHDVPFCLAGSIRDDGPLPETIMDLIEAQAQYAELIRDADMILMLSSMLHSIATGNMTPAGARLICVDINPAVVTKLSDRGSLESVGIVTDVGLFLNLLTRRLREVGTAV